jgi:hypothetical protein
VVGRPRRTLERLDGFRLPKGGSFETLGHLERVLEGQDVARSWNGHVDASQGGRVISSVLSLLAPPLSREHQAEVWIVGQAVEEGNGPAEEVGVPLVAEVPLGEEVRLVGSARRIHSVLAWLIWSLSAPVAC